MNQSHRQRVAIDFRRDTVPILHGLRLKLSGDPINSSELLCTIIAEVTQIDDANEQKEQTADRFRFVTRKLTQSEDFADTSGNWSGIHLSDCSSDLACSF